MTRPLLRGACAAALSLCSAAALAHATLAVTEAEPDAAYRGVIRVGHGCAGSPTTAIRVTVPDGVVAAQPMPKPGWTVAIETGPYAKPALHHGRTLTEGVRAITWSGASLPDAFYDEFTFVARMTGDLAVGSAVPFPILQTCEAGRRDWAEIAAAGQDPRSLKEPAPLVRIVAGPAARSAGPASVTAGPLTIEAPWLRATPAGAKVAGGYLRITNRGPEADRLVGASLPIAGAGEIHEMATRDGVMTMREVPGGLEIPPGGSVELKPGGFHVMFTGLTGAVREGEPLTGTLRFEKAGTVTVRFGIGGLGARTAPDETSHH